MTATGRRGGVCKHESLHRMILGITDPRVFVDHINHDTLDNRRENIRAVDCRINSGNRVDNKSGYTCVNRIKNSSRWVAKFKFGGKYVHVGSFKNKYSAAIALWKMGRNFLGEASPYKKPILSEFKSLPPLDK